jgi:nucleoside-diphosphate-sugar epimerase
MYLASDNMGVPIAFDGSYVSSLIKPKQVFLNGVLAYDPAKNDGSGNSADMTILIVNVFTLTQGTYPTIAILTIITAFDNDITENIYLLVSCTQTTMPTSMEINVIGTANLLDVAFKKNFVKDIVVVTTDKVYRNDNSGRAFVETDPLGGKDPYSASKVGTESVVAAWQQIAKVSDGPLVIAVRGGNVVGGGDYAIDRLIPDLVRGIKERKPTSIRNPESVRPWQHVLDLSVGYLSVLEQSLVNPTLPAFNFGPNESGLSVSEVAIIGKSVISETSWEVIDLDNVAGEIEASKLNLDSENALEYTPALMHRLLEQIDWPALKTPVSKIPEWGITLPEEVT